MDDGATVPDFRTLALPNGPTLAYAEYGSNDGEPVFCFHGNPGSRLLWTLFDEPAERLGVRLVAPDRPGFGRSAFQSDRELLDWPADVAALADHLGVETFGVLGFSAGGPHATACAAELPERVERTVLVGSATPPELHEDPELSDSGFGVVTTIPGATRAFFGLASLLANHWRSRFRAALAGGANPPDSRLFEESVGDALVADAVETFRSGSRGPAHEFSLLAEPWGFDLSAVEVPVSLWHGECDGRVERDVARAFTEALPGADLTLVNEAHYSTLVRNREAILRATVER